MSSDQKDIESLVTMESHCVGKAYHIQPRHGHALSVVRRGQQSIHQSFIGIFTGIVYKLIYFFRQGG